MGFGPVLVLLAACSGPGQVGNDTADDTASTADADGDGLSDADEAAAGCDPSDADSDDDGLPDADEVAGGTDCANPDSDGDDLCDGVRADDDADGLDPASQCNLSEAWFGCDPASADGDGGGTADGVEVLRQGTDCADGGDDVAVCVPDFDFETWDGDVAPGFSGVGVTVAHSTSEHTGESSASLTWSGAQADFVFGEPLSGEGPGNCVFRAWVDENDFDASATAAVRTVVPDGSGGWTPTGETVGSLGSLDGAWTETVVEFPCAGTWQPMLRLSSIDTGGTVTTDDWLVHAADHDPFVLWDGQTDARGIQLSGPDGPIDLYAYVQSSTSIEGTLYVSGPWAAQNSDQGVIVWAGEPGGTADPPWNKAGTIPDADGRIVALMQEGSDPATNQWRCEWAELGLSGSWLSGSTTCSGGQSTIAAARLEGTFSFLGTGTDPWPEQFWFAVASWQSQDNGALSNLIPDGDGDATIEVAEVAGPYRREDLTRDIVAPCAGVGDPLACPGPQAPGTSACGANLLDDGGFEDEAYGTGVPDALGEWGGDLASTEGYDDCRTPMEGASWLRFGGTDSFGASADDRADAIQLVDAGPLRGDTVALSASFLRALDADDGFFGVEVRLYDGDPDDFPVAWARGDGTVLGHAGAAASEVPGMPWATARPEVEVTVPAGDGGYMAIVVFALEDASNDDSDPELAAHFVDDVCLESRQALGSE